MRARNLQPRTGDLHEERGPVVLLADRAYEAIRDRIITLQLPPGSPINESALTRELGVGRTPIREAIKRLALEDLATVYPRLGSFVSEVQITDLADISDLRVQLEGHAAYRASERATPSDREMAEALIGALDQLAGAPAPEQLMDADARVHRFIYACSRNPYLASAAERYLNLSLRIWHVVLDRLPHLSESVLEHRALLRAVSDHQPELARRLAREHVATFEREIRSAL
jgi:DNA-binding GntR family transcriptional regulator